MTQFIVPQDSLSLSLSLNWVINWFLISFVFYIKYTIILKREVCMWMNAF